MSYRKPDLHAPRYRKPIHGMLNAGVYADLRQAVPQAQSLDDEQLKRVILTLNQLLSETVLDARQGIELPESTGHLFLGSCPGKKKGVIDHRASGEAGHKVLVRNWETDGLLAKVFYSNSASRYRFKHHELWGFKPCRNFRQLVGRRYPGCYEKFVRIDPDRMLKDVYARHVFKQQAQQTRQQSLADYDELAFDD